MSVEPLTFTVNPSTGATGAHAPAAAATPSSTEAPAAVVPATAPAAGVAPAATPPADPEMAQRFKDLERQTRGITAERRKLSTERESLAAERAELEGFRKLRADAKRNPAAFQKAIYGDNWYQSLTEYQLAGTPTPELVASAVDEKLDAFRKEQAEASAATQKAAAEAKAAEDAKTLEAFHAESAAFTKAKPDEYELIGLLDCHHLVGARVVEEHRKTGKVISTKEAADLVEADILAALSKAKTAKKFLAKASPQPEGADKRNDTPQRRTLSNDMTATTAATLSPPKNREERVARALAAMQKAEAAH